MALSSPFFLASYLRIVFAGIEGGALKSMITFIQGRFINVSTSGMGTIGIDEAGRGSLAGPVVVAAVSIPLKFYPKRSSLPKLRDSKKLSHLQRAVWFEYLKNHKDVFYTTARVYERGIERINITRAANLAASRALERLMRGLGTASEQHNIFLDGSLYLGKTCHKEIPAKTIVRGDEKIIAIKLASIIAKETRDAYMIRLHSRYPVYQLHAHKGYGTEMHRAMIALYGPSEIHRLTYLKKHLQ